jgi:hypothetical protein
MFLEKKMSAFIGFEPISLFVDLEDSNYHLADLEFYLERIKSFGNKDIIFQNRVIPNITFLQWFTARLIAEEFYVSIVIDCKELMELAETTIYAQRFILMTNGMPLKTEKVLDQLGENDIIIMNTDNVTMLKRLSEAMKTYNCNATLYFNTELLDKSKVLYSGVMSYPFGGLNASKKSTDNIGTADRIGIHKEKS